jgi:lipopolysaccharide/colanic/teichoic acid biosynthesis glycosyltransferase
VSKAFRNIFKPFSKQRQEQSLIKYVHSPEEFRLILERERVRTERTGFEFSFVVFDIRNIDKLSTSPESLINLISKRIRLTDEVGWFNENNFGTILPATSTEGALKFANDICQRVGSEESTLVYRIYTYPTKWLPNEEEFHGELQFHKPFRHLDMAMSQWLFACQTFSSKGNIGSNRIEIKSELHPPTKPEEGIERLFIHPISIWKRSIDIIGSTIALLLFSPVMLAAALAIKLTSRGPIIFKQERLGFLGKRFTFLKFRSMYVNQNSDIHKNYTENFIKNGALKNEQKEQDDCYKIKYDPRVTLVGTVLRKTSIDELPQLMNVLKGEMTLVGPRPPIPYEYENYDIWHKRRVLETVPGITGLWQVKGRSSTTFNEMVRLDLKYINNRSLQLDIKILFQTLWAVLSRKGAY